MPACRTRSWRYATAPWAGASPALPATAEKAVARLVFRHRPARGRAKRRSGWRKIAASSASTAGRSTPGAATKRVRFICSTCAIPPSTKPDTWPKRSLHQADSWCRPPINMSARSARASYSPTTPRELASTAPSGATIDAATLHGLLSGNAATVVDLSLSPNYLARHIPGAWFAIRTRLDRALRKIPLGGMLVFTSEDGALAKLAVAEAAALTELPVRALDGGNNAWQAAGYAFSKEGNMADEAVDQWRKPYERSGDAKAAMQEYLAWETDLRYSCIA